jgi:hypothetical protein
MPHDEMFRQLGWILYSTRCGPNANAMDSIEEFMQNPVEASFP